MVSHEQLVLIVHPDPELRAGLAQALAPRRIVAVGTRDDATRTLAQGAPDVILADAVGARKLILSLERFAPRALRIFLCSGTKDVQEETLRELVEVASEGHEFYTVELTALSVEGLSRSLGALLRQRSSRRVPAVDLEASFAIEGERMRAVCLDVGSEGFQLKLPVGTPIERIPPGTRLSDFRIERQGRPVLRSSGAFVRHLGLERAADQVFFRLGVQMERPSASHGFVETATLDERVRILAVLRRALRHRPQLLCTLMQGVRVQEELPARLVEEGRMGLRCGLPRGWTSEVGDVMSITFDLSGKSYRGWCSVLALEPDGLLLSLPRSLSLFHRRSHMRFRADATHTFAVSFASPLTGQLIERPVVDLHIGGLAFLFDGARDVLPTGLCIDDFTLVLPDGRRMSCGAEIRDSSPFSMPEGQELLRPFRAGVRLERLPEEARSCILEAFVKARCPEAQDGRHESFHDIWELIRAAGLFHPDYPFEEGPHLKILEDTHRTLAATGEGLAKIFLYAQEGRLLGHASGLRTHSRTWMLQHLAVRNSFQRGDRISRELSELSVDYAESLEDVNYLRICWRVKNRWPERVFGWIARSMHLEGLTLLRQLHYMRLPTMLDVPERRELPRVRLARAEDLRWLESHLRGRGEVVRLLADDLLAHEAEMPTLRARYAAHGLHRCRTLFVVEGEDAPVAMALAHEASPGLSWAEMTTFFNLVVPDPSHPRASEARQALVARCLRHYREHGKVSALGLVEEEDVADLVAAGFHDHGCVAEWTFHRSTARTWHTMMGVLFDRLQARSSRRASQEDIAA